MSLRIALAGNPNSGKTTLFNALTGSNQFVGNWPGVTVEKKEGKWKGQKDVTITDLPGIYSLSPYTLEEVVARKYLLEERPDAILNIVDGTNLERNLYLTTQLMELGIPIVVAVNMMDIVRKNGDIIEMDQLAEKLGCPVVEITALKSQGINEAAQKAVDAANAKKYCKMPVFAEEVEEVLAKIEAQLPTSIEMLQRRFYAIKVFERDMKIAENTANLPDVSAIIESAEEELDDDSESIITSERYILIGSVIQGCYEKKSHGHLSTSDKIDRVVTNRWLALPIFAVVMFCVYFIAVTTVGTYATDWANDGLFGDGWLLTGNSAYQEDMGVYEAFVEEVEALGYSIDDVDGISEPDPTEYGIWVDGVPVVVGGALEKLGTPDWMNGLIIDGMIGGVGAVLGFVPQMLVLFFMLGLLESCGYMARIAFIMDRIFRRFGLSGKSFIPMLVGTGCGVPGVMASRTIENENDRRMTIMTTTFIPCGAKLPVIAMIAGALFGGAAWVAPSAYFIGIGAIVVSGIILKKTKMFIGEAAPFVMELPAYHMPTLVNVLRSTWERGWSFIKKAGTIILLCAIMIWFLSNFGMVNGSFGMVDDISEGLLANIGNLFAWLFTPLGWGNWQSAVATFMGLVAKENVVGTFGVLYGMGEVAENGSEIWGTLAANFTSISAYSFLVFNLLCAPCFAAIGAIKREMNNTKWTLFAIGYQTMFAYVIAFIVYQLGNIFFADGSFGIGTVIAAVLVGVFVFLLIRPDPSAKAVEEEREEIVA